MCHLSVIMEFFEHFEKNDINNKRILEIGSKYVYGSVRLFIEKFLKPREYIGIDIEPGRFVDIVLPAERIDEYFEPESFDIVIATEVLEHVRDWRVTIQNMKKVLKKGGIIYITTRSKGFPKHGYPYDFWRYEINDMKKIFQDFEIKLLMKDPLDYAPGVVLIGKKPSKYSQKSLKNIALYSMILNLRTKEIPNISEGEIPKRDVITEKKSLGKRIFQFPFILIRKIEKKLYNLIFKE